MCCSLDNCQFSSVNQLCLTLGNPMDWSMPGFPVHCQLPEFTQTHLHWVSDAIQPSHPLSSLSPHAFNLSQHQGFFKWVSSSYQVAKISECQLQHQSKTVWIISTAAHRSREMLLAWDRQSKVDEGSFSCALKLNAEDSIRQKRGCRCFK